MTTSNSEHFLSRYLVALETGDLDTQERLLTQVADNASLVDALWETHIAYDAQCRMEEQVVDAATHSFSHPLVLTAREAQQINDADIPDEAVLSAVTWRDVAQKLRGDAPKEMASPVEQSAVIRLADALERLPIPEQLPTGFTTRDTRTLLVRLTEAGQGVANSVVRFVQQTLLAVAMEREETFRLAAARREHLHRVKPMTTKRKEDKP